MFGTTIMESSISGTWTHTAQGRQQSQWESPEAFASTGKRDACFSLSDEGNDALACFNLFLLTVILENWGEGSFWICSGNNIKYRELSISRLLEAEGTVWRTVMTLDCRRLSPWKVTPQPGLVFVWTPSNVCLLSHLEEINDRQVLLIFLLWCESLVWCNS